MHKMSDVKGTLPWYVYYDGQQIKFKCPEKGILYEMVVVPTGLSKTQRLGLLPGDGERVGGWRPRRKIPNH